MKNIQCVAALVLAGCGGVVSPPQFFDESRSTHSETVLSGSFPAEFQLFPNLAIISGSRDMGRQMLSLPRMPICDVASVVFGEAIGLQHSCSATAFVSLFYDGTSAHDLANLFAQIASAVGVEVAYASSSVVITGGDPDNEASGAVGYDGESYYPVVAQSRGETVPSFSGPLHLVAAPRGFDRGMLEQVRRLLHLDVRLVQLRGVDFLASTDREFLAVIATYLESIDLASVFVPVPDSHTAAASAIAEREADTVQAVAGGLFLAGGSANLAHAMSDLRKVIPVKSDYRINAALVSFSAGRGSEFSAQVQTAGADRGPQGALVVPGGRLSAVLDIALSSFSASVVVRPSLTVTSGSRGRFSSGRSVPLPVTVTQDGVTTRNTEFRQVGVILDVLPVPVGPRLVRLEVRLEISSIDGETASGPVISEQVVTTIVEIAPGDLVILSGLTETSAALSSAFGVTSRASRSKSSREVQLVLQLERSQ